MMSNGPCSSRRSFQSGTRSIVDRLDLLGRVAGSKTWRKPSALEAAQRAPQLRALVADDVRAEVPVGPRPVALLADRSRQVEARSRPAGSGTARASSTSGLRASGCTLVASITVSRPRASRLPAMKWSTSNASSVADLVVLVVADQRRGRRRTRGPRSAGSACGRTWTCPSRVGPIRTTRESSGGRGSWARSRRHPREDPHLRRRPDLRVLRPDRQEPHARSRSGRRRRRAQPWNSCARPLEAVVGVAEACRRGASPSARCTRGSASSARPSRAGRTRRGPARRPPAAAGRGARRPRPPRRRRSPPGGWSR